MLLFLEDLQTLFSGDAADIVVRVPVTCPTEIVGCPLYQLVVELCSVDLLLRAILVHLRSTQSQSLPHVSLSDSALPLRLENFSFAATRSQCMNMLDG